MTRAYIALINVNTLVAPTVLNILVLWELLLLINMVSVLEVSLLLILHRRLRGKFISATNNIKSDASGFVTSLATRAQELCDAGQTPTVTIETDSKNVFIHKKDNVTLGVYKLP
jgi:hypothetical protein